MRDAAVLLEHVNAIDGWLADEEAMLLYDLAAACTAGCIVEIGSWQGKSTVCLAFGAADGHRPRVYAIDPHQGSPEVFGTGRDTFAGFQANLERAGVSDLVTPLVQEAATAAATFDQPIGLLFIDGDHSAAAVWKDFELWGAKVINGGIIALHDTTMPDTPGLTT